MAMKIPKSVRYLYQELEPKYKRLQKTVDARVANDKPARWHYESRVKTEQSFALKLETGRERCPSSPEDFFGATLVVENKGRIAAAEQFVTDMFQLAGRRPRDAKVTHLQPHSFDFDDLRLYVKWPDDPSLPPSGLHGTLFEVQIKTFLQHAWGIATHDFIYKADKIQWSTSRIAYQVKAMLENAELSIGEARTLTGSPALDRTDNECRDIQRTIADITARWERIKLPTDLRRLAQNVLELSYSLERPMEEIWGAVGEATEMGAGANTLNLSPYASIIDSLIRKFGVSVFNPLGLNNRSVFVPDEIDLTGLPPAVAKRIIRPATV